MRLFLDPSCLGLNSQYTCVFYFSQLAPQRIRHSSHLLSGLIGRGARGSFVRNLKKNWRRMQRINYTFFMWTRCFVAFTQIEYWVGGLACLPGHWQPTRPGSIPRVLIAFSGRVDLYLWTCNQSAAAAAGAAEIVLHGQGSRVIACRDRESDVCSISSLLGGLLVAWCVLCTWGGRKDLALVLCSDDGRPREGRLIKAAGE